MNMQFFYFPCCYYLVLFMSATQCRYRKFQEVCIRNGINALLVAHHADDQVITASIDFVTDTLYTFFS